MKRIVGLLCIIHLSIWPVVPVLVQDSSGTIGDITQPVSASVFDTASGAFFVGLSAGTTNGIVLRAPRSGYGATSVFQSITPPKLMVNRDVEFLTLATSNQNIHPIVGVVLVNNGVPQTAISLDAIYDTLPNTGIQVTEFPPVLLDGSGALGVAGLPTSGIVGLAGNQNFFFVALKPCGGNFGSNCNGGIATVAINQSTLALQQMPAQAGDGAIKAEIVDPTTPQLLINNSPNIVPNVVDLYWDDTLQRLFIGLQLSTPGFSGVGTTCPAGTAPCNTNPIGICSSGLYFDPSLNDCVACPNGAIFDTNAQACVSCPGGGVFNPLVGACVVPQCPFGSFFNTYSQTCVTCGAGLYWDQAQLSCVTCANGGFFNPTGGGVCTPCPTNQYFDPNQGACVFPAPIDPCFGISCPAGYVCDSLNATCILQPIGPGNAFDQAGDIILPIGVDPNILPSTILPTTVGGPFNFLNGPRGPINLEVDTLRKIAGPGPRPIVRVPANSGARSVIVASVNADGVLTFESIAPDGAFIAGDPNNRMVGVLDVIPRSLAIKKVRTMHASTGPTYLIINGGDGIAASTGNLFYALPLVDDPVNNPTATGTLAAVNAPLTNYKFTVPATTNAQLPASTDPAVMIGGGPLSIPAYASISNMQVSGDTVYVSINNTQTATTETGILYSQAMFDQDGKIVRWTPWTKRAFPVSASSTTAIMSSALTTANNQLPAGIFSFAVDAYNSKTWAVTNNRVNVYQTAWEKPKIGPTIDGQINSVLTAAAPAVLDLDQSTRGFLSNTSRYALVASINTVYFARTSISTGNLINSPQTVTTDYTAASNFLVSELPFGNFEINVLEYAKQLTGTPSNYFFAGTTNGLYVFSVGGNGFDVSTMGALSAPPFSTGSWTLAPTITGGITDVTTTGNALYVTTQFTTTRPAQVFRIPFAPTVAAMFAPGNISLIAQAGVGIFANVISFNGTQIISTMPNGSTEQLVLATNNGLYISTRAGGVQAATSQADATWIVEPNATSGYYNGIAEIDNANVPVSSPSTVWPFIIADAAGLGTFDRGIIQQLAGTADAGPFNFVPPFFNSIDSTNPAFATIPLLTTFWSDGNRRIMTIPNLQSSCTPEQLLSLPYNTIIWNIVNPDNGIIGDPVLDDQNDFYWVKQIGITGVMLAGTDTGVVALA